METLYDWVTVGIFSALVTHYIAHMARPGGDRSIVPYLAAGICCGFANWLGNHGWHVAAWALILSLIGVGGWIWSRGPVDPRH